VTLTETYQIIQSSTAPTLGALTEHERARLHQWNDTQADFPQVCTHELFELQVDRDPEAVAVVFGKRQLSYREPNEQANRVAHHLRRRGVSPNVLVVFASNAHRKRSWHCWPLEGRRCIRTLDSAYPKERLSFRSRTRSRLCS
jgi:non-ribosomal peptide synthetase component F